jgi:nitrogen fixation protein
MTINEKLTSPYVPKKKKEEKILVVFFRDRYFRFITMKYTRIVLIPVFIFAKSLSVESVPITTEVESSNPALSEMHSIYHHVIQFVSCCNSSLAIVGCLYEWTQICSRFLKHILFSYVLSLEIQLPVEKG